MKALLRVVSLLGLALTVLPPLLVLGGHLSRRGSLTLMLVGMVLWFGTAVLWIGGTGTQDE